MVTALFGLKKVDARQVHSGMIKRFAITSYDKETGRNGSYFFGAGEIPPGPGNAPRGKGWGAAAGNLSISEVPG